MSRASTASALVVALTLGAGTVGVLVAVVAAPRPDRPVAAVFAPWLSREEALLRVVASGLPVLGAGGLPNVIIAAPDGTDGAARLSRRGAWLVLDAAATGTCTGGTRAARSGG